MNGLEKRIRIFKKYSNNLKESLAFHNVCAVRKISDTEIEKIEEDIYICPLCNRYYYEDSVYKIGDQQPLLTLEHNPPENIGGSASLLSCAFCNNSNGTKIDKVVSTYLNTDDFTRGKEGARIQARFRMADFSFRGELELNRNKPNIIYLDKQSNEFGFSKIQSSSNSFNKVNFDFKLADWETFCKSLLKITHLTAFKYLGYTYLLNSSGYNIMQVLNGKVNHPHSNYGVVGLDFQDQHEGLNVIDEPNELKGLLVVQKVKTKEQGKNIGILIPAPDEGGWQIMSNINDYKNKQVEFKLTKHEFKNFPCAVETYYRLFS